MTITIATQHHQYGVTDIVISNAASSSASQLVLNAFDGASIFGNATITVSSGASLPSTTTAGQLFLNTTDGKFYYNNGTTFVELVNQVPFLTTVIPHGTAFPGSPSTGNVFWLVASIANFDQGLYFFDGSVWKAVKYDNNMDRVSFKVTNIPQGDHFPSLNAYGQGTAHGEFPLDRGTPYGTYGALFLLTASYNFAHVQYAPGLYYDAGIKGDTRYWVPVTGLTLTTDYFEVIARTYKTLPDIFGTLPLGNPNSISVVAKEGLIVYKTSSDKAGFEGLYIYTSGAWAPLSV